MEHRRACVAAMVIGWALLTLSFAFAVIFASSHGVRRALAHNGYQWIAELYGQAPSFDADFKGCCGRQDCFPVAATFTRRGGVPGWEIHDRFGGFVPDKDARPSHDPQGRHWRCYVMRRDMALGLVPERPRTSDGKPCFFPSRGDF